MQVVFLSDLHVHEWPEFNRNDERLLDCVSVLADVRRFCLKHSVAHVFFGGDLFHTKGVLYTKPYALVAEELRLFKKAGITFYAVDGNHDHEDKSGSVHALQPLMKGRLITGIPKRGWRNVWLDHGKFCITLMSYTDSVDETKKRIVRSVADRKSIQCKAMVLMHHGFKNARVGTTLEFAVREPLDAAELDLDSYFNLVFSGHYHTHQQIAGCNGWYIGSPLEFTRSDRDAELDAKKGFIVLDVDTMKWRIVPLKRPRFMRVKVGDKLLRKVVEGNFIDVVYEAADETLDACLEELRKLGARAVNPIPEPEAKAKVQKRRLNVDPALAPQTVLKRYVRFRRKAIKKAKLDTRELLRVGRALVNEAAQED